MSKFFKSQEFVEMLFFAVALGFPKVFGFTYLTSLIIAAIVYFIGLSICGAMSDVAREQSALVQKSQGSDPSLKG